MLLWKGKRKESSAGFRLTTNNRMEILAAISALSSLNKQKKWEVELHSDSRLLSDAINKGWLKDWEKRGWKKSDRKPVLNKDLWMRLLPLLEEHHVKFFWVQGHAGIPENERCDQLASQAALNPLFSDEEYEKAQANTIEPEPEPEPEPDSDFTLNLNKDKLVVLNKINNEKLTLNYDDIRKLIHRLQDFLNKNHS